MLGMDTQVITAGRATNDNMHNIVVDEISEALGGTGRVLVLGLTFKEDVPDTRNSKSIDVVNALIEKGFQVEVHDPHTNGKEGLTPGSLSDGPYDAIALLVPHKEYLEETSKFVKATREGGVIYDIKSVLDRQMIESEGRKYLAL